MFTFPGFTITNVMEYIIEYATLRVSERDKERAEGGARWSEKERGGERKGRMRGKKPIFLLW